MTRERAKDLLPVIQAFAEGKQIQCRDIILGTEWCDMNSATWCERMEYRIKPANGWYQKLANQFHWWIAKDKDETVCVFTCPPRISGEGWINDGGDFLILNVSLFKDMPEFEGNWCKTLIEPEE